MEGMRDRERRYRIEAIIICMRVCACIKFKALKTECDNFKRRIFNMIVLAVCVIQIISLHIYTYVLTAILKSGLKDRHSGPK